ncbi:hypothetical protein SAMN04488693_1398 [Arthrobacter subterraneus]|uniref:Uncharacterized protein n=1 Tax=Arthrobacter subterraneus TaxID=335973 RepID=A0A1G8PZN7_9MICC|nr:hypothetical protein [Arthrobacter subterraneus]SDI97320.1 hypothetical protein SAMN04488693_1398 [Arthrobacter subterraneus]
MHKRLDQDEPSFVVLVPALSALVVRRSACDGGFADDDTYGFDDFVVTLEHDVSALSLA